MADMEYIDRETIAKKCAIIIHIMKENHLFRQFIYCLQHYADRKIVKHSIRNMNDYIDNIKEMNDLYLHDKQLNLSLMLCHSYFSFVFFMDKNHNWHKIMGDLCGKYRPYFKQIKKFDKSFPFLTFLKFS